MERRGLLMGRAPQVAIWRRLEYLGMHCVTRSSSCVYQQHMAATL
jgi:hypothetical protein